MPRTVNYKSVRNARVNNLQVVQVAASGSYSAAHVGHIYFLRRIEGTATTIKDANGNTIMELEDTHEWEDGFRIDDGFTVENASGTTNDLEYFFVAVGVASDLTG